MKDLNQPYQMRHWREQARASCYFSGGRRDPTEAVHIEPAQGHVAHRQPPNS
jgi:hypothetical protein